MNRLSGALVALVVLVLTIAVAGASAGGPASDGPSAASGIDTSSAIVQLNGDPLSTYVKTKPAQGKKIDFSSSTVEVVPRPAERTSQRLQAVAAGERARREGDGRVRHRAERGRRSAERHVAGHAPERPDGEAGRVRGLVHAAGDRPRPGAHQRDRRAGVRVALQAPARSPGPETPHQGRRSRHRHRRDAPVLQRRGLPGHSAAGTTSPDEQQGHRREGVQQQGAEPRLHSAEPSRSTGRTSPARWPATTADERTTTVDGVLVRYGVLGVAPRAQLGNYNVFPDRSTNARSEDILNALDAAYEDGMDVVNMSLGGSTERAATWASQDLLMNAVDDLDQAGMVSRGRRRQQRPRHSTRSSRPARRRAR